MAIDRARLAGTRWPVAVFLLATPLVAGLASLVVGQSVNWDLLNYHLYNPHAWWTGRAAIDVAPAQLQSFHNPLLHWPYYLGFRTGGHHWLAFLTGAIQGLLVFPLYRLARGVLGQTLSRRGTFYVVALGLLGPIFLSELGTVFGDSLLAIPMVAALALVIRSQGESGRPLTAGLLAGAAAGLKLTLAVYLPALLLATLIVEWPRRPLRAGWLLCTGIVIGIAGVAGWWMVDLYQRFDNPLFPMLNGWFESPWAPAYSHRDLRYLPEGLLEGVFKPLIGALDYREVMELKFRGPRVLILFLCLLALPLIPRRVWPERRHAALLAWCAASMWTWSFAFGHYRYLGTLEAVAPVALAVLWYRWGQGSARTVNVVPLLLILSQFAVKVPDWGRDEYGSLALPLHLPEDSALVVAGHAPSGWLALSLDPQTPFIRISGNLWQVGDGTRMSERARQAIAAHEGPLVTVFQEGEERQVTSDLRQVGLYLDALHCQPLQERPLNSLPSTFRQCPVTRFSLGVTRPEDS